MSLECPKCGDELYYRALGSGGFYSCKSFPKCRGKMSARSVWLEREKEIIMRRKEGERIQKAARIIANMRKTSV